MLAQATDINSAITAISGFETAGLAIGVAILLWTVGRRVLKVVTSDTGSGAGYPMAYDDNRTEYMGDYHLGERNESQLRDNQDSH